MRRGLWPIAFLSVVGVFFWYMWSLGSLPDMPVPVMHLQIEKPEVELRHAGEQEWRTVSGTVEVVAGDTVRTGPDGRATIRLFEMSEHRLAPSSEMHVLPATVYDAASGQTLSRLRLQSGRVWSRVLRLLDMGSAMTIETNRVVATVRGTAFDLDVAPTSTWIRVAHGALGLASVSASSVVFVAEGEEMIFDARGSRFVSPSSSEPVSPWVADNTKKDEDFFAKIQAEHESSLASLGEIHPEELRDRLTILSERLHLFFAMDDEAPALYARYLTRRLYAVKKLIDGQMSGRAFQALSAIEQGVLAYRREGTGPESSVALERAIRQVAFLTERTAPDSALYRFKQRLEDMRLAILSPGTPGFFYVRLLTIEARLDETAALLDEQNLQAAAQEIEAAHQGILNMSPDLRSLTFEGVEADLLREKLAALEARERSLRRLISMRSVMLPTSSVSEVPPVLPSSEASSTLPLPPTSTAPSLPVSSTHPVVSLSPSSTPVLLSLYLVSVPASLTVGTEVSLTAEARYMDGTNKDATSAVGWSSSNARLGFFVGSTLHAAAPGTVTVTASYTEGQMVKTVSQDILITP